MTQPIRLRIILGDDDARKLVLPRGLPDSLEELCQTIKTSFGLQQDIRLQYQDAEFGNEFINLSEVFEIHDKASLKVIYLQSNAKEDDARTHHPQDIQGPMDCSSVSSDETEPVSTPDSSPSTRQWVWPSVFTIPRFKYDAELELEKANAGYKTNGTILNPSPKLKSHILERLREEIIQFKAYPSDDLNDVAEALVQTHPCLREKGVFQWLLWVEE